MHGGAALCSKVTHMASKNRITVNLSDAEFFAFGQLAQRSKVTKAWLGRHAITALLEREQGVHHQLSLPLARAPVSGSKREGSQ
jgi:predicted transcriptional regulator